MEPNPHTEDVVEHTWFSSFTLPSEGMSDVYTHISVVPRKRWKEHVDL
jgi:hypothetical protein